MAIKIKSQDDKTLYSSRIKEEISSSLKLEGEEKEVVMAKVEELDQQVKKETKESAIPRFYSISVIVLFLVSNAVVFILITVLVCFDSDNYANKDYVRYISKEVILALIAGTVTQTAAAFILVGKTLNKIEKKMEATSTNP